jgi:uncharacterized protein (DUF486 family)
VESDCRQLGHCFLRVLFRGAANRFGSYEFTSAQLKTIQEVITLSVFSIFPISYLAEPFKWNYAAGFAFIALGAFFVFHQW